MKIAGCIFQNRFIHENSKCTFKAIYKGKRFYITTDHGFGKAKYPNERRFMIDVFDVKTGLFDVEGYADFETMEYYRPEPDVKQLELNI